METLPITNMARQAKAQDTLLEKKGHDDLQKVKRKEDMISGYNDHTINYRDCWFTSTDFQEKKDQVQCPSKSLNYTTQGIF